MSGNDSGSFVGSQLSSPVVVSFVILHSVCVINGVFGSVLILGTLALDRKLRQRTVTCSIYIGNLVLPNLYFQLYFFPMMIAGFVLGFYPAASELHCVVTGYLSITCYFVYQHNLIAISVDRYARVCHPNLHTKYFTKRNTILICVLNWCVGLVVPISSYMYGLLGFQKKAHACVTIVSVSRQLSDRYWAFLGFTGPLLSVAVFLTLGALNLRIFYAYYKIRSRVSVSGSRPLVKASDVKLMRAMLGVFLCMLFCYLPSVVALLFFTTEQLSAELMGVFMLLFSLNTSVDWLVYGVMHSSFRLAYRRLLCGNSHGGDRSPDQNIIGLHPIP